MALTAYVYKLTNKQALNMVAPMTSAENGNQCKSKVTKIRTSRSFQHCHDSMPCRGALFELWICGFVDCIFNACGRAIPWHLYLLTCLHHVLVYRELWPLRRSRHRERLGPGEILSDDMVDGMVERLCLCLLVVVRERAVSRLRNQ
jgi:hypothetical protein